MDPITIGALGAEDSIMDLVILGITVFVGLAEFARRIAQKVPGKTADQFTGRIEKYLRLALDFTAGFHGKPNDPSAIKSDDR